MQWPVKLYTLLSEDNIQGQNDSKLQAIYDYLEIRQTEDDLNKQKIMKSSRRFLTVTEHLLAHFFFGVEVTFFMVVLSKIGWRCHLGTIMIEPAPYYITFKFYFRFFPCIMARKYVVLGKSMGAPSISALAKDYLALARPRHSSRY